MKPSALIVAAMVALQPAAALAETARDEQWIYRDRSGDGTVRPVAIMLSWDYSNVLFVATCEVAEQHLRIRHPAYPPLAIPNAESGMLQFERALPMALASSDRRIEGRTWLENGASELVGSFLLTDDLVALLDIRGDDELMIDVENETGDPWFAGHAEPLRRLAVECRDAR